VNEQHTFEGDLPTATLPARRDPMPPSEVTAGPLAMAMQAMKHGMSIADMRDMLALQKEWEANEARKAFVRAVAEFKKNPPVVYKDKDNAQFKSKYTSIGNMVNTVNAALSQHGLSANWRVEQEGHITVTCVLTHDMGCSETCTMSGPPDASGAKNPLQQIKSTITYLKLATYEAVVGVASSDANEDDDGSSAGGIDWVALALACETEEGLADLVKDGTKAFTRGKDVPGYQAFMRAVGERRKQLRAPAAEGAGK
jgi:hypothetical protein